MMGTACAQWTPAESKAEMELTWKDCAERWGQGWHALSCSPSAAPYSRSVPSPLRQDSRSHLTEGENDPRN